MHDARRVHGAVREARPRLRGKNGGSTITHESGSQCNDAGAFRLFKLSSSWAGCVSDDRGAFYERIL